MTARDRIRMAWERKLRWAIEKGDFVGAKLIYQRLYR